MLGFKEINMSDYFKIGKMIFGVIVVITAVTLTAASFSGWGYKALDGDSITVAMENEKVISVELEGVDCPELDQDFGKEARDFTKSFIYKKKLLVEISSYDSNGHVVARVSQEGKDLSLALLEFDNLKLAAAVFVYLLYANRNRSNRLIFLFIQRECEQVV